MKEKIPYTISGMPILTAETRKAFFSKIRNMTADQYLEFVNKALTRLQNENPILLEAMVDGANICLSRMLQNPNNPLLLHQSVLCQFMLVYFLLEEESERLIDFTVNISLEDETGRKLDLQTEEEEIQGVIKDPGSDVIQ